MERRRLGIADYNNRVSNATLTPILMFVEPTRKNSDQVLIV